MTDDRKRGGPGFADAAHSDPADNAREAERLFSDGDRSEVEEANEALKRKRSERPSTFSDSLIEGKFGSPD